MNARIVIEFDAVRGVVGLDVSGVPIGLAQMMVHEAAEQLGIMRRRAAAEQMQQDALRTKSVIDQLAGNRRGG